MQQTSTAVIYKYRSKYKFEICTVSLIVLLLYLPVYSSLQQDSNLQQLFCCNSFFALQYWPCTALQQDLKIVTSTLYSCAVGLRICTLEPVQLYSRIQKLYHNPVEHYCRNQILYKILLQLQNFLQVKFHTPHYLYLSTTPQL